MSVLNYLVFDQPIWISNISNLTSITILGALIGLYKRFDCDKQGCYRIARNNVKGTSYRTCTKHLTAEDHEILQKQHAIRRPVQHRFLNKSTS